MASTSSNSVMTEEQKTKLKKLFDYFDADKDGTITMAELKKGFAEMNYSISDMEIANILSQADADGSDSIDFEEYVTHRQNIEEERLKEMFDSFDKNKDGYLEVDEVIEMAKAIGHGKISKRRAKFFIKSVDEDNDKRMNFEEFKKLNIRGQNPK